MIIPELRRVEGPSSSPSSSLFPHSSPSVCPGSRKTHKATTTRGGGEREGTQKTAIASCYRPNGERLKRDPNAQTRFYLLQSFLQDTNLLQIHTNLNPNPSPDFDLILICFQTYLTKCPLDRKSPKNLGLCPHKCRYTHLV